MFLIFLNAIFHSKDFPFLIDIQSFLDGVKYTANNAKYIPLNNQKLFKR